MDGATLEEVSMDGATLEEVSMDGATLEEVSMDGATLEEVSMEMDSVQPAVTRDNDHDVERSRKNRELRQKCGDVFKERTVVLCVVIVAVWAVYLVLIVIRTLPQEYTAGECDGLPDNCNYSGSGSSTATSPVSNTSLVCSEGFYVSLEDISNGTTVEVCRPECGEWEEFPHSTVVALDVMQTVAGVTYMISGAVVLVLSVIRYKQMFTFPSVFIIYSVLCGGVVELFLHISKVDQKTLFCNSQDLIESMDDPTAFCTLSGAIFAYFVPLLLLFSLFHGSALLWGVKYPFHYRKIKHRGYIRYVHIGMVLVALLFPWVSVGLLLGTGGFRVDGFPPTSCFPEATDTSFYAFFLPNHILEAVGVSLVAVIIQHLCLATRRRNVSFKAQRGNTLPIKTEGSKQQLTPSIDTIGTPELKLLIIFIHLFLTSTAFLVAFTLSERNAPKFADDLKNYFACEATGAIPGKDCSKPQDRLGAAVTLTIANCLLGLYALANLIYVVNIKELKRKFSRCRVQLTAQC